MTKQKAHLDEVSDYHGNRVFRVFINDQHVLLFERKAEARQFKRLYDSATHSRIS